MKLYCVSHDGRDHVQWWQSALDISDATFSFLEGNRSVLSDLLLAVDNCCGISVPILQLPIFEGNSLFRISIDLALTYNSTVFFRKDVHTFSSSMSFASTVLNSPA